MALDINNLPRTLARTPASIVIQITDPNNKIHTIGAVTEMSVDMSRRLTRRFELDTEIPGSSVEIIPGALQNLDITIRRAMLYYNLGNNLKGGDFIEFLREKGIFTAYDILAQAYPFDILEVRYNPITKATESTITYKNCFVERAPYDYKIDGDWLIIQDIRVMASFVKRDK